MNDIANYAKTIIEEEVLSLQKMQQNIDHHFAKSVKEILKSKGKIIVCGIGKSADIGRKIVATFNSTGTKAHFMHATDAIHGDLGIIDTNDILLLISKSGETPEIRRLLPILKKLDNKIIAMIGNLNSTLAQQANWILNTSIEQEAGPHHLAPTSSTTCQLVMGDALAMSLMKLRNISRQDFARSHPGGALGKKILYSISQCVVHQHNPTVLFNQNLQDAILEISKGRVGATAVVNTNNKLVGIITDGDIRRMFQKKLSLTTLVKDIVNAKPQCVDEDELASTALAIMNNKQINQLVVLDKLGNYKYIIHIHDILKEGI